MVIHIHIDLQALESHFKFSAVYVLCADCLSDRRHSWTTRMSSGISLVVYGSDLNITGRTHVPVEEQAGIALQESFNVSCGKLRLHND